MILDVQFNRTNQCIEGKFGEIYVIDGEGAGNDGGYYSPSIDSDGWLSWTPSKSDMPIVPTTNIKGPVGADGKPGKDGQDGKSAYQYAQDGGYTGTEEEFAEKLAAEYLDTDVPVLRYDPQTLTAEQQAVARGNIGAQEQESVYELIETITVEEGAVVINRTQEPDGTPYNFKSLQVFITVAANVSTTYSFALRLYSNSTKIGESYVAPISNHTAPQYFTMKCKAEHGRWLTEWSNWVKTKTILTILNQDYYVGWRECAIEQYPTINQIQTSNKLPVGSSIEIWGERA